MRELTIEDIIGILRKRWPVLVLLAVVGAGSGWQIARVLPKRYKSKTVVLVEQPTVPGDYVKPVIIENVNQRLATMQQEILSQSHLEPIIKQYGLYPEDIDRAHMDDLVARLQNTIDVTPIEPMAADGIARASGIHRRRDLRRTAYGPATLCLDHVDVHGGEFPDS